VYLSLFLNPRLHWNSCNLTEVPLLNDAQARENWHAICLCCA
jgi:hypothetical protein